MLTLEALQANDGDCFLLHSDGGEKPVLILVDGGSRGVYCDVLEKRLDQLRGEHPRLELRMVVVSHIDADHITGLVDMFRQMSEDIDDGQEPKWKVASLWHNGFDKLVGSHSASSTIVAAAAGSIDVSTLTMKGLMNEQAVAVVASVNQGKALASFAKKLAVGVNRELNGKLIVAPEHGQCQISITSSLKFTVLGPRQAEIDKLQKEWDKSTSKHGADEQMVAADYLNRTVPNLSSIVFLAQEETTDGKQTRILMTGDAGGDLILRGLQNAGLLDENGRIRLNVLKIQHHGSNHSVTEDFFSRVLADDYVISGNGKHGNPHMDTLKWLSHARSGEPIDIYMTNRHLEDAGKTLTKALDNFLNQELKKEPLHRYHFRSQDWPSIVVGQRSPMPNGN